MVLGVSILFANQPSFDCAKVKKDTSEGIICASDTLMTFILPQETQTTFHKV